ncbi:tyrosine-type recombinase/integrase [Amycolatopsis sp. NBC_01480]|uniref:tyrosine-type recombinase/integrase n=1 Tax=Amycolatopsis sp. NBC_01480 TaxID=2903562 RepID=UPI002E2B813D|nr:tyrosine-type recombinase/integrase [Amycolatopsis sp. NBC_01480]
MWEIRVVVGTHPLTGRSKQRSFTIHGDEDYAAERQAELVADHGVRRVCVERGDRLTVEQLLDRFESAPHRWSPTTLRTYGGVLRDLRRDRLARCWLDRLTPAVLETALARWAAAGATPSTLSARFHVLHSAITWGVCERLLGSDPLVGMRSPPRPYPRKHLPPPQVRQLFAAADRQRLAAAARLLERPMSRQRALDLFHAEQDELLVRLAADSGARRGELAALRVDDLEGRVLSIERAAKDAMIGPTKTHSRGRLTLGATTARCWHDHVRAWRDHPLAGDVSGSWLFAARPDRHAPIQPSSLGHRFERLRNEAGLPAAQLHRLRHTVGTYLVAQGKILKAAARLRHRDPSTTLRNYADALPLDDEDAADELDALFNDPGDDSRG